VAGENDLMKNKTHKTKRGAAVGCSALLGRILANHRANTVPASELFVLGFKLCNPSLLCFYFRILFNQVLQTEKLILLYLLDKRRCLAVLDSLDQFRQQRGDFGNEFKCSHSSGGFMRSNDPSSATDAGKERGRRK